MAEKSDDQEPGFTPDLLIIPTRIAFDKDLQPLDSKVYGVIYWLERLKDGRCWASNATIGKIVGANATSVSHSLSRLLEKNYVITTADEKGQRKSIITVVNMGAHYTPSSNEQGGSANEQAPLAQMSKQDNKIKEKRYTSEMESDIKTIYHTWLIYWVIGPDRDPDASLEEKAQLIEQASKRYRLTPKRKEAIARRLADAGRPMVAKAIKNLSESPFHRGESEGGWTADLVDYLLRSYEMVEKWANKGGEET